uniref:Uncharacterized protein n=1 Tax=Setaria viridis TaxID=4556 RepID=A0A4V6D3J0_SETVI|nr:hypothetical protein SEVIR_8G219700v2 [Setaria viridis]
MARLREQSSSEPAARRWPFFTPPFPPREPATNYLSDSTATPCNRPSSSSSLPARASPPYRSARCHHHPPEEAEGRVVPSPCKATAGSRPSRLPPWRSHLRPSPGGPPPPTGVPRPGDASLARPRRRRAPAGLLRLCSWPGEEEAPDQGGARSSAARGGKEGEPVGRFSAWKGSGPAGERKAVGQIRRPSIGGRKGKKKEVGRPVVKEKEVGPLACEEGRPVVRRPV